MHVSLYAFLGRSCEWLIKAIIVYLLPPGAADVEPSPPDRQLADRLFPTLIRGRLSIVMGTPRTKKSLFQQGSISMIRFDSFLLKL